MVETSGTKLWRGHEPEPGVLKLELFRLASLFLSSRALAERFIRECEADKSAGPGHLKASLELHEQLLQPEATRILLTSAIMGRTLHERRAIGLPKEACGTITTGSENKPLQLWDAFNKIIHATTVNFDSDTADHMGMLVSSPNKDVHLVPRYWKSVYTPVR